MLFLLSPSQMHTENRCISWGLFRRRLWTTRQARVVRIVLVCFKHGLQSSVPRRMESIITFGVGTVDFSLIFPWYVLAVEARLQDLEATTTGELQRLAEGQTELWATLDQVKPWQFTRRLERGPRNNMSGRLTQDISMGDWEKDLRFSDAKTLHIHHTN